jgi:non-ribosomal peptide synthetase component E (peptide arylation enzyme)
VAHLCLIPSLVHQLVNSREAKMADLSSLKSVSSAGAYLPDDLKNELVNMGPKNIVMIEGNDASSRILYDI